jgi:hypothetical protein
MATKKSVRPPRKSINPGKSNNIKTPVVPRFTLAKDQVQSSICPVCGGEVVPMIDETERGSIFISIYDGAFCKKCKIRFESMPDPKLFKKLNP